MIGLGLCQVWCLNINFLLEAIIVFIVLFFCCFAISRHSIIYLCHFFERWSFVSWSSAILLLSIFLWHTTHLRIRVHFSTLERATHWNDHLLWKLMHSEHLFWFQFNFFELLYTLVIISSSLCWLQWPTSSVSCGNHGVPFVS